MTSPKQYLLGTAFIAALALAGCASSFNSWTPRAAEPVSPYSCASGYLNCQMNGGSFSHDHRGARGAAK
jgi:hypothetical protein